MHEPFMPSLGPPMAFLTPDTAPNRRSMETSLPKLPPPPLRILEARSVPERGRDVPSWGERGC